MMLVDLSALEKAPRLLIEAELKPVQGTRFQPTGFPNLGPARFAGPDGTAMLLVESAQSMANRMEAVCWDDLEVDWVNPLKGLPFVRVKDGKGVNLTSSPLEAHRLNSAYIENSAWFSIFKNEIGYDEKAKRPIDMRKQVYPVVFKYDPNSIIHGFFLESIAGAIRSPRALSAFIEARSIQVASSGGVKNDRVDPSQGELGGAKEGYGNVPFARDEFTGEIVAYFNVDLSQIRGFGLGADVERLLTLLCLYKIRGVLERGLRLRTACDLDLVKLSVTRPVEFEIPPIADLEADIGTAIKGVGEKFASPPITDVVWQPKAKPTPTKQKPAGVPAASVQDG